MNLIEDSYASYINLAYRIDRNLHMQSELERVGLKAERFEGIKTSDYVWDADKTGVMQRRTPGAIGCHFSQVKIMETALVKGKHAWIMEDDLLFADDIQERIKLADDFLEGKDWQIFWWGGTFHTQPAWWHKPGHSLDLPQCNCTYGVDVQPTDNKQFVRTLGAFSTHCYVVNKNFIEPLLEFLDANVHLSMGIDWLMILLQPMINSYAFVPGSVIQMDNMSDIGNGLTVFSGFKMLGNHWFQKRIEDFDYEKFKI